MRFKWKGDPQEFDGPPVDQGLLAGFSVGELRWMKRELKFPTVQSPDIIEARIIYCLMSMRRIDHTLLPFSQFEDLTFLDFEVVPHVMTRLDADGDCAECQQPAGSSVHLPADPDAVDPTQPAEPEDPEPSPTP